MIAAKYQIHECFSIKRIDIGKLSNIYCCFSLYMEYKLKDEAVRKRAKEVCCNGSIIVAAGLALLICYRLTGRCYVINSPTLM